MKPKFSIKLLLKRFLVLAVLLVLLLIMLWILIGLGERSYAKIRNYYGYCTRPLSTNEDIRGHRFTTEERLDIAINHYLRDPTNMDYYEIRMAEQMESLSWRDLQKRFTLIPHGDKEEFLRANPDCCNRSWGVTGEYEQFGFWERTRGAGDGMFNFKHKVRNMDQEGARKEIESTSTYMMVHNCGYVNYRVYTKEDK